MKKIAILAAFLGTLIEVYDFSIFAFLIPILSEVFFSSHEKKIAIDFILLAYVISYGVKPLGALAFGYLIDYIGRKKTLLCTTALMTIATAAIGLLPTNEMGMMHPWVALVGCRIIQGLSISGEFPSALILAVEQGRRRPALSGSLAFMGGGLGLLFANLSAYILLDLLPHEEVIHYEWRVPFLISTIWLVCLCFITNKIDDSSFNRSVVRSSFRDLIANNKKQLMVTFITASLSASAFYMTFIYMPTFLSSSLNLHSHQSSILITLISLIVYLLALPGGDFGG